MTKKGKLAGIAITMIAILVLSSFIVFFDFSAKVKEGKVEKEPVREVDDRISPLENQAVTLEISRIRKKGIEPLMRKIGTSWKKKPNYHFQAILNDEGLWTGKPIREWDTEYVGWEAFRFVEEEQTKCNVEIKIIETKKKLFRSTDQEVLSLKFTYDFKTGRWDGDDKFNDSDGYGHYNGKNYEIWFGISNSDYDGDRIPYWTEVNVLYTNPRVDDSKLDPDDDGIPTAWEWKWGYNPFIYDNHTDLNPDVDGLSNLNEYKYKKFLANPFYKDIYMEVDFMKSSGLFDLEHVLHEEAQQVVMDLFSNHEITAHFDDGCMGGGGEYLDFFEPYIPQEGGIASEYYKYHFADDRKGVFHYIVMANAGGWCHPQDAKLRYDAIVIPTNREHYRSVYMPPAITTRQKRLAESVAVMHEMGHSLGLMPAYSQGVDNLTQVGRNNLPKIQKYKAMFAAQKHWDNYESTMNYHKFGQYYTDYSDGTHGEQDSDDWSYIDLTYFQRPSPDSKEGIDVTVGDLQALQEAPFIFSLLSLR